MRLPLRLSFRCSLAAAALTFGFASTALAQSPPAGASAAPAAAHPLVEIDGQRGYLESRPGPGAASADDSWRFVCELPCRRPLDPSREYQISGLTAVDSRPFRLPEGQGRVHVDADVGSMPFRLGGLVLTPLGGATFGIGLLGTLIAASGDNVDGTQIGAAVAAGGALALGLGIAMLIDNRTTVTVRPASGPALQLSKGLSLTPRGLVF